MVEKVLRLLQRKERWLVVAGVRFLRTCIGTKVRGNAAATGAQRATSATCLAQLLS